MGHWHLPDGLPSGQFLPPGSPSLWQSDAPVADPVQLWARCQQREDVTGLRPVLCGWPIHPWPASDLAKVTAFRLEAELEASWRSYRELQLNGQVMPVNLPADVEPWEPDPGAPYERWPGLAPAVGTAITIAPAEIPRLVLAGLVAGPCGLSEPYLVLVPAARSADIPVVIGWDADVPRVQLSAMLRSWEDRFGARVVAFRGARIYVSVARPPRTAAHAAHVALEHLLTGADNVNEGWPHFPDYAASLIGAQLWSFWWD
jgi:Domain of unknown function (DUF4253)